MPVVAIALKGAPGGWTRIQPLLFRPHRSRLGLVLVSGISRLVRYCRSPLKYPHGSSSTTPVGLCAGCASWCNYRTFPSWPVGPPEFA